MSVTRVQFANNTDATSSATIAVSLNGIAAGSLVEVHVTADITSGKSIVSVVDDLGASALAAVQGLDSADALACEIWYFKNHGGGNRTFTATFSTATIDRGILVAELAGASLTSPLGPTNTGTANSGTALAGSVTPTVPGSYVSGFMVTTTSPMTAVSPIVEYSTDATLNTDHAAFTQSSPAAINPSWTFASGGWGAVVAVFQPTPAPIEQEGYRFRNDDGSETTATWLAAQDTDVTQPLSTNTRLRILLNATGDPASTAYRLDYKKSTDSIYIPVLTSQPTLSRAEITAGALTTNVLNYVTASVTLTAGRTYLLGFTHSDAASEQVAAGVQTTGGAVAFSSVTSVIYNTITTNVHRLELWQATPVATVTDTITITLNDAGTGCAWILEEYTGCGGLGTPVTNNADTVSSISATPGALAASTSHQIAFSGIALNSVADTATGTGWSTVGTGQSYATPTTGIACGDNTTGTAQQVTFSGAGSTMRAVIVVEVKQAALSPILISASSNITASGENTTAQLAAPSGKSTSDFVTGRMQDDENPADAIDITTDDYTELEWCLTAVSGTASNGDIYQFQVTNNGAILDTYTLTPQWTIGTAGGGGGGGGAQLIGDDDSLFPLPIIPGGTLLVYC